MASQPASTLPAPTTVALATTNAALAKYADRVNANVTTLSPALARSTVSPPALTLVAHKTAEPVATNATQEKVAMAQPVFVPQAKPSVRCLMVQRTVWISRPIKTTVVLATMSVQA